MRYIRPHFINYKFDEKINTVFIFHIHVLNDSGMRMYKKRKETFSHLLIIHSRTHLSLSKY